MSFLLTSPLKSNEVAVLLLTLVFGWLANSPVYNLGWHGKVGIMGGACFL